MGVHTNHCVCFLYRTARSSIRKTFSSKCGFFSPGSWDGAGRPPPHCAGAGAKYRSWGKSVPLPDPSSARHCASADRAPALRLSHILICFSLSPCNGEASFIPTLQIGLSNWATVPQPRVQWRASSVTQRPLGVPSSVATARAQPDVSLLPTEGLTASLSPAPP